MNKLYVLFMERTHEKCRKSFICCLFMVFDLRCCAHVFVHACFSETGEF